MRMAPSGRLCESTISPWWSTVRRVLPPPACATRRRPRLARISGLSRRRTPETVRRLSSVVSITSTSSPVAMRTRSRNMSLLPASRTALVATART